MHFCLSNLLIWLLLPVLFTVQMGCTCSRNLLRNWIKTKQLLEEFLFFVPNALQHTGTLWKMNVEVRQWHNFIKRAKTQQNNKKRSEAACDRRWLRASTAYLGQPPCWESADEIWHHTVCQHTVEQLVEILDQGCPVVPRKERCGCRFSFQPSTSRTESNENQDQLINQVEPAVASAWLEW